jgi:iron uptake system component EfeO
MKSMRNSKLLLLCTGALMGTSSLACSSSAGTGTPATGDDQQRQAVTTGMHDALATEIATFLKASQDLQTAAPTTAGRGWDATDAAAITAMKDAWTRVRKSYERIEGAIAPLFQEFDFAVDARYDDYLGELKGAGDMNLFDDQGVTGQHGIERVIYSDSIPPYVVEFESKLPGYAPASFPKTETEAADFKAKLCGKLAFDITTLQGEWTPAKIDLATAFQGLVALMNEQREKVNLAATQEEEWRYSQRTLADLHDNLDGTINAYNLFKPWILSKAEGPAIDATVRAGFDSLKTTYNQFAGDAIPQPPATWSSQNPTEADKQSDFGKLFVAVQESVDPAKPGSVVDGMNKAAKALGFPEFVEEP